MKINPAFLAIVVSVLVSSAYSVVQAKACGDSFYCYGDTAESLATTSTRPPPIPPPNTYLRRLQQRNQQHIAVRNRTAPAASVSHSMPTVAPPTPTSRATRPYRADEDDGISVIAIPARPNPPMVNRVQPPPPAPPTACRPAHLAAMNRAESLERLGAIAAKRNDRAMSLRFFGEAKQIRVSAPSC